jgi:hypothetical protein
MSPWWHPLRTAQFSRATGPAAELAGRVSTGAHLVQDTDGAQDGGGRWLGLVASFSVVPAR